MRPLLPALISSGLFEIKICNASVDPIPSRMSVFVCSFHRRNISAGNASPADTEILIEERSGLSEELSESDLSSFNCAA